MDFPDVRQKGVKKILCAIFVWKVMLSVILESDLLGLIKTRANLLGLIKTANFTY